MNSMNSQTLQESNVVESKDKSFKMSNNQVGCFSKQLATKILKNLS